MQISFRTNAGGENGWGNLIRLYNLYLYLYKIKPDYNYLFIIEGDEEIFKYLSRKKIKFIKLKNKISIKNEKIILNKIKEKNYLICEMLDLSYARQLMYKKLYKKVIVFDDLINQKYAADYVICAQEWPSYKNIKISDKNTKFLLGYDYFIFNKNYKKYNEIRIKKKLKSKIKSIVVILGGSDYEIAYMKVAQALKKINKNIKILFIIGFSHIKKNKKTIKSILPNAKIMSNVSDVSKYIYKADVAIVGGGYTKIEAAYLLTPSIIISVQWHQLLLANQFSKITKTLHLGYFSMIDEKLIEENLKKISLIDERIKIRNNYLKLFKNNSLELIINKIF